MGRERKGRKVRGEGVGRGGGRMGREGEGEESGKGGDILHNELFGAI